MVRTRNVPKVAFSALRSTPGRKSSPAVNSSSSSKAGPASKKRKTSEAIVEEIDASVIVKKGPNGSFQIYEYETLRLLDTIPNHNTAKNEQKVAVRGSKGKSKIRSEDDMEQLKREMISKYMTGDHNNRMSGGRGKRGSKKERLESKFLSDDKNDLQIVTHNIKLLPAPEILEYYKNKSSVDVSLDDGLTISYHSSQDSDISSESSSGFESTEVVWKPSHDGSSLSDLMSETSGSWSPSLDRTGQTKKLKAERKPERVNPRRRVKRVKMIDGKKKRRFGRY